MVSRTAKAPGEDLCIAVKIPTSISTINSSTMAHMSVRATRRRQYLPPRSYQVMPTPGSAGMSTSRGSALRGGSDAASGIRASPVAMLRRYL